MKLDHIKEKKESISVVLCVISVLLAVLVSIKMVHYLRISARAQDAVKTITAQDNTNSEDLDRSLSRTREMVDSLKKSNLFTPPKERKNPVTTVQGILGNEAFINNKWYKEGEMCQDAKIVKIEPTQVTIEWDGKTTILKPLEAASAPPAPGGRPPTGPEGPRPPTGPEGPRPSSPNAGSVPPSLRVQPPIRVERQ